MRYNKNKFSDISDFSTLLSENNIPTNYRWYPNKLEYYEYDLSQGLFQDLSNHIRKNMARGLQYLEYLELQLNSLSLSENLCILLWKNYILTASSIIEAALYHILPDNKKFNESEWGKPVVQHTIGEFSEIKDTIKLSVIKQTKLKNPKRESLSFESIIDTVVSRKILKSVNYEVFAFQIKRLKNLRNRVHLTAFEESGIHDYYAFKREDYIFAKFAVFKVLTDDVFNNGSQKILPNLADSAKTELEKILNTK